MRVTSRNYRNVFLALLILQTSLVVNGFLISSPVSALSEDLTLQQPTNICGESRISSVDLSWDTPIDSNVTGHVMEYQTYGAVSWTAGPEVTEVNRVTVPGVNGTRYTYRVASTNNSGQRSAWGSYCLLGWGEQYSSSVPIPFGRGALAGKTVTNITAGQSHTCAVLSDGTAACWGDNDYGQLGNGTNNNSNTPVAVTGGALTGKAVTSITAGQYHTCAVLSDGTAACWGYNNFGQLGNGTTTNSNTPVAVTGGALTGKAVTSITAGDAHTCAVLSDGTAACWGWNDFGQLGNGTNTDSNTPVAVTGGALAGKTVTNITAVGNHMCAVLSDGTAACWGWNGSGQLGNGTNTDSNTPVAVTSGALAGKAVTSITAGDAHSCAVLSDGTAACWGYNGYGQVGNGTNTISNPPVAVTSGALAGKTVTNITAGHGHSCAVLSDDTAACWGWNGSGQLGNGTNTDSNTPVAVTSGALAGKTVTNITAGDGHSCAVLSDGTAACWGYNGYGQLGNGTTTNLNTPVAVTSGALAGKTVTNITAGQSHTCAVLSDDTAACWGWNGSGQLGNDTTTNSNTPVAVTRSAFALLASGSQTLVGVSDGSFVPGEEPTAPRTVTSNAIGRAVTAMWTAPVRSGAGPVTGYRSEYSYDAGRTWSAGSDWSTSLSDTFTVPRDGYVLVRVQAKNAAAESSWAVTGNEILIVTDLSLTSGRSVTKSNVSVTFQFPDGDPVIGSSVAWETVDGSKRGVNPVTTNANGVATFSVINTGPILFTLSGGGLGSQSTKISSASLTDVISKSGSSLTVILPTAPNVVARTITTSMPDGSPVPEVSLTISGGIAGTTSTGVTTNLRSFTTSWNYDGWIGNNTTAGADGVLTIYGFQVQSVGRDVTANFSDGEISQDAYGSLTTPTTNLMFDQMPVVQLMVDDTKTYIPGEPVTVEVVAIDGAGDPIQGADVILETVTSSQSINPTFIFRSKNIGPMVTSCSQQLSGQTSSSGKVTLQLCASTTDTWRADGLNIVPSRPVTIMVSGGNAVFNTVVPSRIMDTRNGTGGVAVGKVGNGRDDSGDVLEFSVLGKGTLPSSAAAIGAVSMNVTVTGTSVGDEGGWVAVFPCGTSPGVSNLNFVSGQTIPNAVITPVSSNGKVCFKVYGKANLIADINGYFTKE